MEFRPSRTSRGPVINVTSLIDVLFLLVIFVLVSARFEPEGGVAVDLPSGTTETTAPKKKSYVLSIKADGACYLDKERVPLEALPERLKAARKELAADPVLIIRADRAASWETVSAVIDIAKQVGQSKVSFKTKL